MDNRAQNLSLQNKPLSLLPSRPLSLSASKMREWSPIKWSGQGISQPIKIPSIFLTTFTHLSLSQTHNVTTTLFSKLCSLIYLVVTKVFSVLFLSLLYLSLCLCYILLIIVDQIFSPSIIHSVPGSLYLFLCFLPESIC